MALPFHLCQPGEGASCGACCGLYNFRDRTRPVLEQALLRRTAMVKPLPRTPEAFSKAARSLRRWDEAPLFPPVRLCPLLGFVDEAKTQVGCLAHPLQNDGIDLRDCGAYDRKTCQSFECPSFLWLDAAKARLVRAACPDWYVYGLVITDVELVRGTAKLLEEGRAGPVDLDRLRTIPAALAAVAALFARKETAPGDPQRGERFGRFAVDDLGEPVPRTIDYESLGAAAAPEDDVVLCLGYAPATRRELEDARALVRRHVADVLAAYDEGLLSLPTPKPAEA